MAKQVLPNTKHVTAAVAAAFQATRGLTRDVQLLCTTVGLDPQQQYSINRALTQEVFSKLSQNVIV